MRWNFSDVICFVMHSNFIFSFACVYTYSFLFICLCVYVCLYIHVYACSCICSYVSISGFINVLMPNYMTWCKQRARFLPTPFLDIFLPIDSYFFAPLDFPHSCRIQTHSSTTTSNHRQVVLKVWWPKNCQKSS